MQRGSPPPTCVRGSSFQDSSIFDCLDSLAHLGQLGRRDELGARARVGDQFDAITDSDRAWVWRSLVYGVRVAHSAALAGLEHARVEPALAQVRTVYELRMQGNKCGASAQPRSQPPARSQRLGAKVWPLRRS